MQNDTNPKSRADVRKSVQSVKARGHKTLVIFLLILFLGCLFGFHIYNNNTPSNPHTHLVVTHSSNRYPYVNYHHTLIGHVYQPSNFKFKTKASEAMVMDAKNGNILYKKNINQPRRIASVSKLMSLYLIARKANKTHSWNKIVPVSSNLRKMSYNPMFGGFKFKPHHKYTVKELYQAALIESSNNAAIALAKWTGGTQKKFVKMMNAQAHVWEINAHFVSPSGLENSDLKQFHLIASGNKNDANLVSAKAVAIIAQHVLHANPNIIKLSRESQSTVDGQKLMNVNRNLKGQMFATKGVDGLKTGFTQSAGYTFCSTEKRHGHRLITVILNDPAVFKDNRNLVNKTYKSFGSNV